MLGKRHDSNRSLISRLRLREGETAEIPISSAEEPCLGCGQETAVGSVFFSDRREITISDGTRRFCARSVRRGRTWLERDSP